MNTATSGQLFKAISQLHEQDLSSDDLQFLLTKGILPNVLKAVKSRNKNWFDCEEFQQVLKELLFPDSLPFDKYFGSVIDDFIITVPKDFCHESCIYQFIVQNKDNLVLCSDSEGASPDRKFINTSKKIIPGKEYRVRLFPIIKDVPSGELCVSFLESKGADFLSVQGLLLLYNQMPSCFTLNIPLVSFDKKTSVWHDKSSGCYWLPFLSRKWDGKLLFINSTFDTIWFKDYCLVCFSEK